MCIPYVTVSWNDGSAVPGVRSLIAMGIGAFGRTSTIHKFGPKIGFPPPVCALFVKRSGGTVVLSTNLNII